MALLPILRYPDPRLYKKAAPIERVDEAVRRLAADMAETMYAAPGIGLAATQVDVHIQLVVIDASEDRSHLLTLINPRILSAEGEQLGEEGCLSVPGMTGRVPRYTRIRYTAVDHEGNRIDRVAEGFHARVVQHECDHLDGILYPMRVTDFSRFGYTSVLFPELDPAADD